ncbi:hypothetical protein ACA910_004072 [Epithemia clementina (nom. ined.)]
MPRSKKDGNSSKRKASAGRAGGIEAKFKKLKGSIPLRIQRKIDRIVEEFFASADTDAGNRLSNDDNKKSKDDDKYGNRNERPNAACLEAMLNRQLGLVHLDCASIVQDCWDIAAIDDDNKRRHKKGAAAHQTTAIEVEEKLKWFCMEAWHQQQLAYRIFDYLDEARKGVVVLEDLQRVAPEFLADDDDDDDNNARKKKNNGSHQDEEYDDFLVEMMNVVHPSSSSSSSAGGDGLLSKEDMVRIARLVNLQEF